MKTSSSFIVIYMLILGSMSAVVPATTINVTISTETSFSTQPVAETTPVFPTTSEPETSVQSTTSEPETSVQSTALYSSFALSTAGSGQQAPTAATTPDPGPWRVVTYALSAVSGVLLLAFTTIVIILCKMRTKLRQASKTLYPITPGPDDHEYLDLEQGIQKKNKRGARVELTHITKNHEEEEFDSPTFSPTPPVKPKRSIKKPPPVPLSDPPTDGAPQLPVRTKNKWSRPKLSIENTQGKSSGGGENTIGKTNPAFAHDEGNNNGKPSDTNKSLYDDNEDETYEDYERDNTAGPEDDIDDDVDMDIQMPYEEPAKSAPDLHRQGSSTGLPDLGIQRMPSRDQIQDVPLEIAAEDTYDTEDFGIGEPGSGLPDMNGLKNFDDLQFFDDPDAMTTQDNKNTEETSDVQNNEDKDRDAPSPTVESLEDLLTYDDADMDIAGFDANRHDDDDEPGLYEDFDLNNKTEMPLDTHTPKDRESTDSENHRDVIESELPKVPPRRKSTIDKNRVSVEQNVFATVSSRSNSTDNECSGVPDQPAFPAVPPRRDMLRDQSESKTPIGSFDEMVLTSEHPPSVNMDTFPGDSVQLRHGKEVGGQAQVRPRDSYFLYMDDKTVELSENSTNNSMAAHTIDLSGLNKTSNISVDLSELNDTDTQLVASVTAGDSESSIETNKYSFDMTKESDNSFHVNGNVPNSDTIETGGSGSGDNGFAAWDNAD